MQNIMLKWDIEYKKFFVIQETDNFFVHCLLTSEIKFIFLKMESPNLPCLHFGNQISINIISEAKVVPGRFILQYFKLINFMWLNIFLKIFFWCDLPLLAVFIIFFLFCHQVVHFIHLVFRRTLELNSRPRTMARTVSPQRSPLDQGASLLNKFFLLCVICDLVLLVTEGFRRF